MNESGQQRPYARLAEILLQEIVAARKSAADEIPADLEEELARIFPGRDGRSAAKPWRAGRVW